MPSRLVGRAIVLGVAVSLAVAGCSSDVTNPPPPPPVNPPPPPPPPPPPSPTTVTWAFCGPDQTHIPIWVAAQDGSGSWTRITGTQNTYAFPVTERGAIAWVTTNQTVPRTQIVYGSLAELQSLAQSRCAPATVRQVRIPVAGGSDFDDVTVRYGGKTVSTLRIAAGAGIVIPDVPAGTFDLIASTGPGTAQPSAMLIRRAAEVSGSGDLPLVDFGSAASVPTERHTVNLVASAPTSWAVTTILFTPTDSFEVAGAGMPTSSTAASLEVVFPPRDLLGPSDLIGTTINRSVANSEGIRDQILRSGVLGVQPPTSLAFGPPMADRTVTVLSSAPALRVRTQVAVQSEYAKLAILGLLDPSARTVVIMQTQAYRNGSQQIDMSVPDLSVVDGWNSSWGLALEGTVLVLESFGWSSSAGGIRTPRQAGTWMSSSVSRFVQE